MGHSLNIWCLAVLRHALISIAGDVSGTDTTHIVLVNDKPMEEAPVLEPLEHLVLNKPLDGGSLDGRSVVDWFVRLIMEPLEHSVLATTSVWEPLEHSNCVVTDHVDIDSFWMAPWDAGGTLSDSCRPCVTSWWTVFRLSCRPAFVDEVCLRLFRSLGRICVLDVHVGQTDVPTGSQGDDPRRNLPPSLMSPGDGGVLLSLSVPLMGKSSRRSGITGKGHSLGMALMTAMCFPRKSSTPGEGCAIDLDMTTVKNFPRTDATRVERCTIGLDITTVTNFPRTGATPGEMCTMDVGFMSGVNFPRTSSNQTATHTQAKTMGTLTPETVHTVHM